MKTALITGYDGFLGHALTVRLLDKGYKIYGLSRHASFSAENLVPLCGDILEPELGLKEKLSDVQTVYHLAALHKLGEDKDGMVWKTNVRGTQNVIDYCIRNDISDLKCCSTAYVAGRNVYERSKILCELMVKEADIPQKTIFKPSIIMGGDQHFSQFVSLLVKVHQRAELIRRRIEGTLKLPVLEPVFRMKANPGGRLNLVSIDSVVDAMVVIEKPGTYWLTHPAPLTLEQLVEWIGECIMVKIKLETDFSPTPIESMFQKMSAAFTPYLWGDDFPSDIKDCPPITREFIHQTILKTLLI